MFKGKPPNGAPTPFRMVGKKDAPIYYCGDVYWFQGCPYINVSAQSKDWKPDEATAEKVEEKIASALDWIKSKIEKLRQQALEMEAVQSLDKNQKKPEGGF